MVVTLKKVVVPITMFQRRMVVMNQRRMVDTMINPKLHHFKYENYNLLVHQKVQ